MFASRSDRVSMGVCLLSRKRPGKLACSQFFYTFRFAACTLLSVHVRGLEENGQQRPYAVILGVDLDSSLCSSEGNIWRRRRQV